MSGRICWLWLKKLALVARISAAQSPARRLKSRSPRRNVKTAAATAASAAGSCAVASDTPPRTVDSAAMIHGKRSGVLRYGCPSTSGPSQAPRVSTSRASSAKRASSDLTIR